MAKCDRCLWSEQCRTVKDDCADYTPMDEYDSSEELITEGLYEFRRLWSVYTRENGE